MTGEVEQFAGRRRAALASYTQLGAFLVAQVLPGEWLADGPIIPASGPLRAGRRLPIAEQQHGHADGQVHKEALEISRGLLVVAHSGPTRAPGPAVPWPLLAKRLILMRLLALALTRVTRTELVTPIEL